MIQITLILQIYDTTDINYAKDNHDTNDTYDTIMRANNVDMLLSDGWLVQWLKAFDLPLKGFAFDFR